MFVFRLSFPLELVPALAKSDGTNIEIMFLSVSCLSSLAFSSLINFEVLIKDSGPGMPKTFELLFVLNCDILFVALVIAACGACPSKFSHKHYRSP